MQNPILVGWHCAAVAQREARLIVGLSPGSMALQLRQARVHSRAEQQRRAFTPAVKSASRRPTVEVRADNCLIVNTKSGGHAFIGLYLAKELLAKGHTVTILNDGDQVGNGKDHNALRMHVCHAFSADPSYLTCHPHGAVKAS